MGLEKNYGQKNVRSKSILHDICVYNLLMFQIRRSCLTFFINHDHNILFYYCYIFSPFKAFKSLTIFTYNFYNEHLTNPHKYPIGLITMFGGFKINN